MSEAEGEIRTRLLSHGTRLWARGLRDLVMGDGAVARADALILRSDSWIFDFAKRLWDEAVLADLVALARARGVFDRFADQLAGAAVNGTEGRAALHTFWRSQAEETRARIAAHETFVVEARRRFEAVVNIGIGGSDLGPRFVVDALGPRTEDALETRFCSNVDPEAFARAARGLDPARTLVLIVSKSFTTQETMANARAAKGWLQSGGADPAEAMAACTARPDRARDFGVAEEAIFSFEDWVGGRFSLWSAAGLAIPLALGPEAMADLRIGARHADDEAANAPPLRNPAFLAAALDWFSRTVLGAAGRVVAPYGEAFRLLPQWLSQVEMESLGKSVRADGTALEEPSVGAVWGAAGTDAQHAFFQSLHQGAPWPVEFLGVAAAAGAGDDDGRGRALLANMIAQGEALLLGRDMAAAEERLIAAGANREEAARLAPHKAFPGGRESATILMPDLDARALGRLLAFYEHKTAFLGYLMGVNPFDQMGVELGKEMAAEAAAALGNGAEDRPRDASTAALLEAVKARSQP